MPHCYYIIVSSVDWLMFTPRWGRSQLRSVLPVLLIFSLRWTALSHSHVTALSGYVEWCTVDRYVNEHFFCLWMLLSTEHKNIVVQIWIWEFHPSFVHLNTQKITRGLSPTDEAKADTLLNAFPVANLKCHEAQRGLKSQQEASNRSHSMCLDLTPHTNW